MNEIIETLWCFPPGLATLITGLLAIGSAIIAYMAVLKRIQIDQCAKKKEVADRQRSVAISFLAELELWRNLLSKQFKEHENMYCFFNENGKNFCIPAQTAMSMKSYEILIPHLGDIGSPEIAMSIANAAHKIIERNEHCSNELEPSPEGFERMAEFKLRVKDYKVWLGAVSSACSELEIFIRSEKQT